jgi:tetratricopeptide (TPR) repeat protein
MALLTRGLCAFRTGDPAGALAALSRFLVRGDAFRHVAEVRVLAGYAAFCEGLDDEAQRLLGAAYQPGGSVAVQWSSAMVEGDMCRASGDWAGAVRAYERAEKSGDCSERRIFARFELGRALSHRNRIQQAAALLESVVSRAGSGGAVAPDVRSADAALAAAHAMERSGRIPKAAELYQRVVGQFPGYVEMGWVLFRLAALRASMGDNEAANAARAQLADEYPEDYWNGQAGLVDAFRSQTDAGDDPR